MKAFKVDVNALRDSRGAIGTTAVRLDLVEDGHVTRCFVSVHPFETQRGKVRVNVTLVGENGQYTGKWLLVRAPDAIPLDAAVVADEEVT